MLTHTWSIHSSLLHNFQCVCLRFLFCFFNTKLMAFSLYVYIYIIYIIFFLHAVCRTVAFCKIHKGLYELNVVN